MAKIIIIKNNWQCKAGKGRLTPYQSEDPGPTQPTYRGKEEKGKIVEDKKGETCFMSKIFRYMWILYGGLHISYHTFFVYLFKKKMAKVYHGNSSKVQENDLY